MSTAARFPGEEFYFVPSSERNSFWTFVHQSPEPYHVGQKWGPSSRVSHQAGLRQPGQAFERKPTRTGDGSDHPEGLGSFEICSVVL